MSATIGRNVKAARQAAFISQDGAARTMRFRGHKTWRQQTLAMVEQGERSLTVQEADTLSAIIHTTIEALLNGASTASLEDGVVAVRRRDADRLLGLLDYLLGNARSRLNYAKLDEDDPHATRRTGELEGEISAYMEIEREIRPVLEGRGYLGWDYWSPRKTSSEGYEEFLADWPAVGESPERKDMT